MTRFFVTRDLFTLCESPLVRLVSPPREVGLPTAFFINSSNGCTEANKMGVGAI